MAEGATLFFMVAHPHRMLENEVGGYLRPGWVKVLSPWGSEIFNFHRPIGDYVESVIAAGFRLEEVEELGIPAHARAMNPTAYARYAKLGALRLAIRACK